MPSNCPPPCLRQCRGTGSLKWVKTLYGSVETSCPLLHRKLNDPEIGVCSGYMSFSVIERSVQKRGRPRTEDSLGVLPVKIACCITAWQDQFRTAAFAHLAIGNTRRHTGVRFKGLFFVYQNL